MRLLPDVPRRELLVASLLTGSALGPPHRRLASAAAPPPAASAGAPPLGLPAGFVPLAGTGTDGREYGHLRLPNGLPIALVSTPDTDRFELAYTVSCGSLSDPPHAEGLAHLAEHLTLAADPLGFESFIGAREGELNGFTQEERTIFYAAFEPLESSNHAKELSQAAHCFAALFARPNEIGSSAIALRELGRIDAELSAAADRPSRQLLEVSMLKARASGPWAKLGRGDARTLQPSRLSELLEGVLELRAVRYAVGGATLALVAPLPLHLICAAAAAAFGTLPAAAAPPPLRLPRPFGEAAAGIAGVAPAPIATPAGGRRGPTLALAWCVPRADPVADAREKPLALLAHALTSPHVGSLTWALRRAGLSPLAVEVEPILTARTITQTYGWTLWQLEVLLSDGAEDRWTEALSLIRESVGALGTSGVPAHVAAEAAEIAQVMWRYSSRPPLAQELALALADEPSPELLALTPHSFVGSTERLAAAASATAARVAQMAPVTTLWLSNASFTRLGLRAPPDALPPLPPMPLIYAQLPMAPVRAPPTVRDAKSERHGSASAVGVGAAAAATATATVTASAAASPPTPSPTAPPSALFLPPPPNRWWQPLRETMEGAASPMAAEAVVKGGGGVGRSSGRVELASRRRLWISAAPPTLLQQPGCVPGARDDFVSELAALAAVGCPDGRVEGSTERGGLQVLQLPGCIGGSSLLGSKGALSTVSCERLDWRRPFAVALLQLHTARPAMATAEQAARGELWRLFVQQALAPQAALAARAGLKFELSFNSHGMRLAVSGPGGRVRPLLLAACHTLGSQPWRGASAAEAAAVHRSALTLARASGAPNADARARALLDAMPRGAEKMPRGADKSYEGALANEVRALLGSVGGASLLLAGSLPAQEATSLRKELSSELRRLTPKVRAWGLEGGLVDRSPPALTQGLRQWDELGLLYRPQWQPAPLSQNLCTVPALAATLDQCG